MGAKKLYLVVKTTYRDNKLIFRDTVCVCSSLKKACSELGKFIKAMRNDACIKSRFATFDNWILVSRYREPDFEVLFEDYFFHIFKMHINAVGDENVLISKASMDVIKKEIYGR